MSPPAGQHQPSMRRVVVIGPGGAGKTTLATRMAELTGLPLIHLDALYWKPGWVTTPAEAWSRTIGALLREERWIMDGNYGGTLEARVDAADTIVFLDESRWRCLWRVLARRVRWSGRSRPSMPEGCHERLTFQFVAWIWGYPSRRRPKVLEMLDTVRGRKRVHVLGGPHEVAAFLRDLEREVAATGRAGGPGGTD